MDNLSQLTNIIEGALLAANRPLTDAELLALFDEHEQVDKQKIKAAITNLQNRYCDTGLELITVASGYRLQVKEEFGYWVSRLWKERPPKYSRALLETLALIAYRQPITRGEIEAIRGVAVSSGIVKTLHEREWIRVVGHKDVPGRPALYATTKYFLDDFNLQSLEQLPPLSQVKDVEQLQLVFGELIGEEEEPQSTNETESAEKATGPEEGESVDENQLH